MNLSTHKLQKTAEPRQHHCKDRTVMLQRPNSKTAEALQFFKLTSRQDTSRRVDEMQVGG